MATRTTGRKVSRARRPRRAASPPRSRGKEHAVRRRSHLPGWRELNSGNERSGRPAGGRGTPLSTLSTVRFALLVLAVAAAFTLYIGHVHATQDLMVALQQAQRENLRLHLQHNRLKGAFDQATGPRVIYDRARAMGLEEGITYGPTIHVAE